MNIREKLRILTESERRNAQHITDSLKGRKENTMKEYKIQIRFESRYGGKWVSARQPFGGYAGQPYEDFEQAKMAMYRLESAWDKNSFGHEAPVDFRIVSRDVSEWEPI